MDVSAINSSGDGSRSYSRLSSKSSHNVTDKITSRCSTSFGRTGTGTIKTPYVNPATYGSLDRLDAQLYSSFSEDQIFRPFRVRVKTQEPIRKAVARTMDSFHKKQHRKKDKVETIHLAEEIDQAIRRKNTMMSLSPERKHVEASKSNNLNKSVNNGASTGHWRSVLGTVLVHKPFPSNPAASVTHQWHAVRMAMANPSCRTAVSVRNAPEGLSTSMNTSGNINNTSGVYGYFRVEDSPMVYKAVQKLRAMTARGREAAEAEAAMNVAGTTTPIALNMSSVSSSGEARAPRPQSAPLLSTHWQTVRSMEARLDSV